MGMLEVSAVLFTLAALGGAGMAMIRHGGRNPPAWLAMGHGFLAAAGLTLLAYAAWTVGVSTLAQASLLLFLLAAAGGAFLNLRYHWRHELIPMSWVWGHGGIAVAGYLLLLLAIFST